MTLRQKIFLTVLVFFLLMVGVIYLTTHLLLDRNIDSLESRNGEREMQQVRSLFDNEISGLSDTCLDWASWDETYAFMADGNEEYADANLLDSTYDVLRLNLVIYVDTAGEPVFAVGYDLVEQEETSLPANLMDQLAAEAVPLYTEAGGSEAEGIITLDGDPMMITTHPILNSQDQGPPRGTLIFGRSINIAEVKYIGNLAASPLTVFPYKEKGVPALVQQARDSIDGASVYLATVDTNTYPGIIALEDLKGDPAALVQAIFDRSLFTPLRSFGVYLMMALLLLGTVAVGTTIYLVDRWVLRRLSIFSRDVQRIGLQGNVNQQVQVIGNDEISLVAETINATLVLLQKTRDALVKSAEQYRDLFETAHDLIQSVD
jgi:sensor domain CHASE-containing protein